MNEKQSSNAWGNQGRIVSHQEYLRRRDKGLCFKCGEPYSRQRRCAYKIMRVTVLTDDEGGDERLENIHEEVEKGELQGEHEVEYGILKLHLYSVGGVNQSRTMKLEPGIEGANVIAMIDNGASHNFVSKRLIEGLGLKVDERCVLRYIWDMGVVPRAKGCAERACGSWGVPGDY